MDKEQTETQVMTPEEIEQFDEDYCIHQAENDGY